ncbi:RNA polymerase sigma-32 factor RpoH [Citrifermentans bemidjiense Bem]|uniref:RNA polymerase sigma factor n=1 Tax=Citrifermentans bemidjiense (strain ATCC BAA-1014 / DSM 16622 / JCM 12645 / Bem) TaxID=404380 RepID=B5ECH3_CITBB|nr:RNA polymerase sigma factor RpoH [Citrifermentans bemidjiense]ACH37601.1 RNA polymerase sigma-32 factor RpoH [Citrifermentans bemidjiense Bem]
MTHSMPVPIDNLTLYLAEINRFPLLTADEEMDLAGRFRREGDLEAAHRLITANLRFVVKIAGEYRSYGMKMLDLIQEGNIGLMMAVRKFDPDKGVRLISYAVWWIRAYIQNHIISAWSLLKIGTTQAQRKLFFKLNQAKQAIVNMTGEGDLHAAAISLDVKDNEAREMEQRLRGELSLDVEMFEGEGGGTFLESLPDLRQNQEEMLAERQETTILERNVASALENLNEKEKFVIEQRVAAEDPMTLQEIADHFSISRERVRQIEEGALKKMKRFLAPLVMEAEAA